ncbi:ABC transporter ATP-binding protein NatA [bacterium HR33]|nr:ABC transporter ATP-binding protein NatA [bacterium HR33]
MSAAGADFAPVGDRRPLIAAEGVWRFFGGRAVLRDVTLVAGAGEVVLLLGPNGAGKTTLLRVLAGLLRPSRGKVERRGRVGMVAHHSMLYDALTAEENLRFFARLRGVEPERAGELLARVGLEPRARQRVASFSRGMVQRLAIGCALLGDPEILLLDEPLSGLDEVSVGTLLELLRESRGRGRAVLVASHQFAELVEVVTSVAYLGGGRLLAWEPRGERGGAAIWDRYREVLSGG